MRRPGIRRAIRSIASTETATACFTGDLFLNAPLSFAQAAAVNVYDMHPVDAAATRMRVLAGLASSGERLLGYHLAWPGLGRVRQTADGFAFEAEPADRSAVKR